jgi:hypothetical protein
MKNKIQYLLAILTASVLFLSMAGTASAAILFQDDTFATVESDAIQIGSNDAGAVDTSIQFGADVTATENGNITWNIGTNKFSFDHTVDITGGLSATGGVDFSGASQVRLRENVDPNLNSACANLGEVIINTTTNVMMVCTTVGTPGVWTGMTATNADTVDGLHAVSFLRSDTSSAYTSGTLTTNAGTTVDVNGALDASGATRFALPSGAANPGTCTIGDVFYNTGTSVLNVCTASNTWTAAGPQDFESIYAKDADKILTTANGNFTIARGSGSFAVSGTGTTTLDQSTLTSTSTGTTTINSGSATNDAIKLNATDAAGGITGLWGTGGLNFSSTTGTFSISGTGASTLNATSGALNLTTTTSGNVAINSAANITFKDSNLTSAIKLNNTQTGLAATYTAGDGIVDALNELTLTTAGNGASNIGLQAGSLTNVTPATNDVQAALVALDAKVGAGMPNVDTLKFNVEYPDTVVFRDGSNNNGTLTDDYDNTNNENYYKWTTNNTAVQDIDLRFRFTLPTDFASVGNFIGRYRTGTATVADNKVDFAVTNSTDLTVGAPTTCASSTANFGTSWASATLTAASINTGCTGATALNAGDIVQVIVKLYDISDVTAPGTFANAGWVSLDYNN